MSNTVSVETFTSAGVDASMKCGKGSVDNDVTRSSVAPTPKTMGSRDA